LDAAMVRRPLLEPNLSVGGLTFLGISLFLFLMGNVVTGTDTSVCETCRVYKKYGSDKHIELKLFGRGIDTSILKKT
jgi:hypothetical protein